MFIFGAGYTAGYLSKTLTEQGWTVYGTTRRQERFDEIAQSGAHPLLIDDPTVSERLSACSHVLISAGPSENGDPTLNDYRSVFTLNHFEWVGYLSTTGVYGGTEGEWVDEDTRYTQQRHAVSNVNRLKKPGPRYQTYLCTSSDWRGFTAQGAVRFPK